MDRSQGVRPRACLLGFNRTMRHRFGAIDCVVTGHLHMPIHRMVGGVLLFSPGAVFIPECHADYDWSGLRSGAYRRFRMGLDPEAHIPAVGVIDIRHGQVRARRIRLEHAIVSASA